MDDWVWIVMAIVVCLLVIGAIVAVARQRKQESNRREAAEVREKARHRSSELDKQEADMRSVAAEAERRRAEADRLEAVAEQRRLQVESERAEHEESLREADEIDPDVDEPPSENPIVDRSTSDRRIN